MIKDSDNPVCMPHVTCTLLDLAIHLPFLLNSNNIQWQVQFIKLHIMQFSPISHYFHSYKTKGGVTRESKLSRVLSRASSDDV